MHVGRGLPAKGSTVEEPGCKGLHFLGTKVEALHAASSVLACVVYALVAVVLVSWWLPSCGSNLDDKGRKQCMLGAGSSSIFQQFCASYPPSRLSHMRHLV
jgi:hypothetical protein